MGFHLLIGARLGCRHRRRHLLMSGVVGGSARRYGPVTPLPIGAARRRVRSRGSYPRAQLRMAVREEKSATSLSSGWSVY